MYRREMLKSFGTGLAALPFVAVSTVGETLQPEQPGSDLPVSGMSTVLDGKGLIGGRTLRELHDRYVFDLFDDFLPLMRDHVIDHEYGGFMCHANRAGIQITTNKSATYEGRGTWVYSYLTRTLAPKKEYREVARKSIDFILKNEPEGDLLWPSSYTREGTPLSPPGDHSESIYRDLFIAEGLAVYGHVTGQESHLDHAKRIIQKALRLYEHPGYSPEKAFVYVREKTPLPGCRILGVPMVLLRVTSQMLEAREDAEIHALCDRCIEEIFGPFHNKEYNLLNEVLNHDMTLPDNAYGAVAYTGHALETLWMVLYEAHRRRDTNLFMDAAKMIKRHMEVSWDYVYGGWFRGCQDVDENIWFLDKAAWVQEETLIGLLFIIEHTGLQWAKEWYERAYTFVIENYPLAPHGFPGWEDYPDRKVKFKEHNERIENFHHPRHLMLGLETIKRMMARSGCVSNDL